jgi:hypothetical protein
MQQSKSGTTQVQTVIIMAIIIFALSGFMGGFAFGAFTRPKEAIIQPLAQNHDIPVASQKELLTPSPSSPPQPSLGCPDVEANVSQMLADSQATYNATIQAKDKTGNQGNTCQNIALEKPLVIDGITCKLWLAKAQDPSAELSSDVSQLQHLDQLDEPSPNEIESGLNFVTTTPQVQSCKQGQGNWKFTLSSTVSPGTYFLVGLTDWQGIHYNWSWYQLQVIDTSQSTNAGQGDNTSQSSNHDQKQQNKNADRKRMA